MGKKDDNSPKKEMSEIIGELLPKRPVGHPPMYRKEMCQKMIDCAAKGGHLAQIMLELGIGSYATFYSWVDKYEEFSDAYESAKIHNKAFYEQLGLMGMLGQIPNFNDKLWGRVMGAKYDDYKQTQKDKATEINIGQINTVNGLTNDQLTDKIKDLQKRLGVNADAADQSE